LEIRTLIASSAGIKRNGLLKRRRPTKRRPGGDGDGVLGDWQLTLAAGGYLGVAIVALLGIAIFVGIATFFQVRVCQVECARLRAEVKRLSEEVEYLVADAQRRFLKELQSSQKEEDNRKTAE
jgi:hypothetical protein